MKKLIFDLETNGLYDTVDTIWIGGTKDLDTGEINTYSDYDPQSKPLSELLVALNSADVVIGHNIISYDLTVLHKLFKFELKDTIKVIDTMTVSQLNFYARPGKHSLANFGKILGDAKGDFTDFAKYSEEMKVYMVQDINLNHKVYNYLLAEVSKLEAKRPGYKDALRLEHSIASICSDQVKSKWKFNIELAKKHYAHLTNEMKKIEDVVNPQLKERVIEIDTEYKTPKYLKDGRFQMTTARMLSQYFDKEISQDDTHVVKPTFKFKRVKKIPADLGNMDQVREMLLEQGWKPTFYTPGGAPKITEDSLSSVSSDVGKQVVKYYSLRSRHSVLKGWMDLAEQNNGRVYVEPFNLGTPTSRQRHSKIVNVPSVNAFFGSEMRELFIADDNKVIVGCDSSGNQIRALAHYLNNKDINSHILNGDIHQHNADMIGVDRPLAKGLLYATVFGAGMKKLGKMVTGVENLEKGRMVRENLYKALPGLKQLIARLNDFYYAAEKKEGYGFIPGLDKRKIYAESNFKCLNYMLQCFEAVTVKTAISNAFKMFKEQGLDVQILAMVHDEVQVQCNKEDAKKVSEILEYSFGDFTTEKLNLNIQMAGEAKVGNNWKETH